MTESVREELSDLKGRSESDIDFSDIPETSEEFWRGAERARFYKPIKKQLTVRIDADVIDWLKSGGDKGYQRRLNAILREAMLSKLRASAVRSEEAAAK